MPQRHWRRLPARLAASLVLAAAAGCAFQPGLTTGEVSAPVPAGLARIWFYRDANPGVSRNIAVVSLNGSVAAYAEPDGGVSYRTVSPGHYHITVESFGRDVNQAKDVDLAAGQEAFVKILALRGWEEGGDNNGYERDTFYVSLVPNEVARAAVINHPFYGGG